MKQEVQGLVADLYSNKNEMRYTDPPAHSQRIVMAESPYFESEITKTFPFLQKIRKTNNLRHV